MKRMAEKHPSLIHIVKTILDAFVRSGIVMIVCVAVLFVLLRIIGAYGILETAFNLKYDSLIFKIALLGFLALSLISFVVALILFFYKYRRKNRAKSKFGKSLYTILNEK